MRETVIRGDRRNEGGRKEGMKRQVKRVRGDKVNTGLNEKSRVFYFQRCYDTRFIKLAHEI